MGQQHRKVSKRRRRLRYLDRRKATAKAAAPARREPAKPKAKKAAATASAS